jgi:hypoxanthine phosphoribosyltransferase
MKKSRNAAPGSRMLAVLDQSPVVHAAAAVRRAIDQLAIRIDLELHEANPVLMVVLQGGLYLGGQLLPRLRFPLTQGTVHVSRYGDATTGAALRWISPQSVDVSGRTVLLVDDVFDAGVTLQLLTEHFRSSGAARVLSAVLVHKAVERQVRLVPDFIGLEGGAEYLFGCGMDYQGYWRNLPEIRSLSADHEELL